MKVFQSNLKIKILLSTGSVIVFLMIAISIALGFKWQKMIIQKESENAIAVSNTFSASLIDAFIYQEQDEYLRENVLETSVNNFLYQVQNVNYVIIYDNYFNPLVKQTKKNYKLLLSDSSTLVNQISNNHSVSIYYEANAGWVIQSVFPLNISNKKWGLAKIGFDAEPIRSEIKSMFFFLFGSTILVSFFTLLVLYFISNYLTSNLSRLVSEIDKFNFDSGSNMMIPESNDEMRFLFQRFTLMKKRIENSKVQLENAQRQIYQAEKLASIGRLASGVAHQVNNPLNGIKSCIYSLQKEPDNIEQTKEYIGLINEGIQNIETVVQKLLGFARQQSKSENFIFINDSILKVVNLFNYKIKEKQIDLILNFDNELPKINVDYHLFQEVIMNLLLNSYDAVNYNGIIEIATGKKNENNIFVKVSDNGIGINPENLESIFDPFFTTKEVGLGTGLGLSVCLGIVESHGGSITVESKKDKGTTFKILLPIINSNENINY